MASSLVQFMPSFWGIVNSRNNPKCKISAGPSDAVTTVSRKNLSAPQQGQTKWLLLHPNTNFIKTHTIKRQPTLYYGRNLKHNPSSLKYKGRNAKESARAYIIYYKHKLDIPEQHLVQNRSTNTPPSRKHAAVASGALAGEQSFISLFNFLVIFEVPELC